VGAKWEYSKEVVEEESGEGGGGFAVVVHVKWRRSETKNQGVSEVLVHLVEGRNILEKSLNMKICVFIG